MKILYIYKDYYPVVGGIENHIRMLAEALAQQGHQVQVLVTHPTARTHVEEINGVQVFKAGRLATISSAPISLSLFAWAHRLEADIAHLHFPYPIGELAYLLAGRSRKMVITYHSDIVRQKYLLQVYKPFLYRLLARADKITVSSPNYIQSSPYLRPLADKCVVIPHGTDLQRFAETEAVRQRAKEIRGRYATPLILFVGLLRYYKGLSFLIEAMPAIAATLLIVGQGPEGKKWQALSQQLGLGEKVVFLGRVSDEELVALYHACDVFVLPAIHRSESWGAVQVEAMACGKPVISTELGTGTSFVNVHGQTGFVVPPKDSAALAEAINTLLQNEPLRKEMGQRARQRAFSEFSLPTMVERVLNLYHQVLGAPI
ncbi:MAG: glycosyltransferase, partial [Chloroflexi bacterium]|nr:glycosyltransferase [Chloroflexota bacterium]